MRIDVNYWGDQSVEVQRSPSLESETSSNRDRRMGRISRSAALFGTNSAHRRDARQWPIALGELCTAPRSQASCYHVWTTAFGCARIAAPVASAHWSRARWQAITIRLAASIAMGVFCEATSPGRNRDRRGCAAQAAHPQTLVQLRFIISLGTALPFVKGCQGRSYPRSRRSIMPRMRRQLCSENLEAK